MRHVISVLVENEPGVLSRISGLFSGRAFNIESLNVAETLADSLTRNPYLRVHVSSGYYDLATPWSAVRYTLNHLQVDPDLAKNITLDTYTAGHMMYLNLPDLKKQKADLARFIHAAAAQSPFLAPRGGEAHRQQIGLRGYRVTPHFSAILPNFVAVGAVQLIGYEAP